MRPMMSLASVIDIPPGSNSRSRSSMSLDTGGAPKVASYQVLLLLRGQSTQSVMVMTFFFAPARPPFAPYQLDQQYFCYNCYGLKRSRLPLLERERDQRSEDAD